VPTPAELVGRFVEFVGDVLGASSLRLGIGPTLVVLAVLLVFLQLVARADASTVADPDAERAGAA